MHLGFSHRFVPALFAVFLAWPVLHANAQDMEEASASTLAPDAASDLDVIEAEIDRSKPKATPEVRPNRPSGSSSVDKDPESLSDLGALEPFSQVSVIQRRFQPKSERFQFSFGLGGIMNDPWFNGYGGTLRGAYHLSETWGLEGVYTFLSNSEKDAAKDLYDKNRVSTSSISSTKGYMGLHVLWTPIYGKMSLFNKRIVPFDMYFSGGLGNSEVDKTSGSNTTFHVGAGQVFALSKSWGFRWDLAINSFSATVKDPETSQSTSQQFNNIILTLGGSFFFPEVKYR